MWYDPNMGRPTDKLIRPMGPATSRREFIRGASALGASALLGPWAWGCGDDVRSSNSSTDAGFDSGGEIDSGADAGSVASTFFFAIVADSHCIDEYYEGPESNEIDTESILMANDRFASVVDYLAAPPVELSFVLHVGDFIHDYPSNDVDFFFQNETAIDFGKAQIDRLDIPFHVGFGNHDYDRDVERELTHDLFREKIGVEPYYKVEQEGWKFLQLNNFVGETWNPGADGFNRDYGSLGFEQLDWLEAELAEGKPTFLFVHYPLTQMSRDEGMGRSLENVVRANADTIEVVVSGHMHRWFDFPDQYGPRHIVMGSTRYDEDAYLIVEVDPAAGAWRFLNEGYWQVATLYSDPYVG